MTKLWPSSEAAPTATSVEDLPVQSHHTGIARLARSADAMILVATSLALPILLGVADPEEARERVVAALGAATVFLLNDTGTRYRLESRLSGTNLPFRACLPSFGLACLALPFILLLLEHPIATALRDDVTWVAISLPALLLGRRALARMLAHERVALRLARRLVVVGERDAIERVTHHLALDPLAKIAATIDERDPAFSWDDLDRILRDHGNVEEAVLAIPYERRSELRRILTRLRRVHADLYVEPSLVADDPLQPIVRVGGSNLAVVQRRPLTLAQTLQKGAFDRLLGLAILLPALPVILSLMLVVRLGSPGPALFRQPRIGLHGRRFEILKLRTMRDDATDLLADRQTGIGDPRVTRNGRWLRKLSLDELPQLFNVVRGDMSLVGPRPHAPNTRASGKLLDDALAEYVIRHQVKPGITGWAQVNGARGQLQTVEQLRRRVALDLEYMQRWSLAFDLRILCLTLSREIFSKHAH